MRVAKSLYANVYALLYQIMVTIFYFSLFLSFSVTEPLIKIFTTFFEDETLESFEGRECDSVYSLFVSNLYERSTKNHLQTYKTSAVRMFLGRCGSPSSSPITHHPTMRMFLGYKLHIHMHKYPPHTVLYIYCVFMYWQFVKRSRAFNVRSAI